MEITRPPRGAWLNALGTVLVLLAFVAVVPACVSGGAGGGSGGSSSAISVEHDDLSLYDDAYQAVQNLRPAWLRARGMTGPPAIFLDGRRHGEVQSLRDISAGNVVEIRFIGAADATTLYGTGYTAGIIAVDTRR